MSKTLYKSQKTDLLIVTIVYSMLEMANDIEDEKIPEVVVKDLNIPKEYRDMLQKLDDDIREECLKVIKNIRFLREANTIRDWVFKQMRDNSDKVWKLLEGKEVNFTVLAYYILYYNFNSSDSLLDPWVRAYKVDPMFDKVKRIYSMDVVLETFEKYGFSLKDRIAMSKLAKDIIKTVNPTRK